ncbi:unnamed protein product [Strongylus vulgaris]|uniref:Alcohol dehydrogenase iron-type/glycerol dehydrogenase GldA domain-containing protein n=1 Tax=Strongylus vulgaris TaxID=40348 RepID=A0A3P7JN68_STRVU|nr:unnamed protein product [Strongylus vulgaris]
MSGRIAKGLVERISQVMGGTCPHHYHDPSPIAVARLSGGGATPDNAFEMICSTIRFGKGVTSEIGYDVRQLGAKHTLIVTDKNVINTTAFK